MKNLYTFKTLYHQIKREKDAYIRSNIYGIISTLLLLPIPMLIPLLIDEILLHHAGKMTEVIQYLFGYSEVWLFIGVTFILVLVLRVGAFFSDNRKNYYAIHIGQRISYLLRYRMLHHLEHVTVREYEGIKSGGIASKTIQDVEKISTFASHTVTTALSSLLMLVGIAGVMLWMNWVLALLVFILNPFFLAFSKFIGRKTASLLKQQNEAYQSYNELLTETLELFLQVRASHQERYFFGLIKERAKNIEETSLAYGYKAIVSKSTSTLLTNSVVDLFRILGIVAVAYSDLSIGMMIAFLFYLSTLSRPIQQLMQLVMMYQSTKPALERINMLFKLQEEPQYLSIKNPFDSVETTSITLKNITFSYHKEKTVLHQVTLKAKKGQKVALIGSSGGGKTTLAHMMVGFYTPDSGTIDYGEVPLEQIGLPTVRENVALMLQQTLFFNDTIRMNLTFAKEKSDALIFSALRAAQLEDFVKELKEGLETEIGKNGIRLSGGQRQRLAMARLILLNPKIVIFDEATSALDHTTEQSLYETIKPFLEGRTTIIIAHRITTIKQADYIYIIERGTIKAEGTYVSLLDRGYIKDDFDV